MVAEQPLPRPLFPESYLASGVLLHVTSLPSKFGIGDVGPGAMAWIDCLHEAHQSWWQALPLGPTGYGDSPYQALSSFAGNGLLLSPDWLIEDGLLETGDCETRNSSETLIDYPAVIAFKHGLLGLIWSRFTSRASSNMKAVFEQFCRDQAHWLDDYALFRALKARQNGASYLEWPKAWVNREPDALARARHELAESIDAIRLAQYLVFRQTRHLLDYAHARGVRLIGDMPFFVSPDSSDVWANPELFLLDEHRRPRAVAGVPPDYFSATGQRWGNPVYDWDAHRRTGYRWWIDRVRALLNHVDAIRLDHFRGYAAAWHVPAEAKTATTGQWVPGPGAELFKALKDEFGDLPFIAEDLGVITPDVCALRDRFSLPGTRVLQFAFDGNPDNPFLPHRYAHNNVVYTGTHDNNTTRGWYESLPAEQRKHLWNYLKRAVGESTEVAWELIQMAMSSPAALAIIPAQDLLNLGEESRMNTPGRADGNWRWRCTDRMLASIPFDQLKTMTKTSNRAHSIG